MQASLNSFIRLAVSQVDRVVFSAAVGTAIGPLLASSSQAGGAFCTAQMTVQTITSMLFEVICEADESLMESASLPIAVYSYFAAYGALDLMGIPMDPASATGVFGTAALIDELMISNGWDFFPFF